MACRDRGAWLMAKLLWQAANEYPPLSWPKKHVFVPKVCLHLLQLKREAPSSAPRHGYDSTRENASICRDAFLCRLHQFFHLLPSHLPPKHLEGMRQSREVACGRRTSVAEDGMVRMGNHRWRYGYRAWFRTGSTSFVGKGVACVPLDVG